MNHSRDAALGAVALALGALSTSLPALAQEPDGAPQRLWLGVTGSVGAQSLVSSFSDPAQNQFNRAAGAGVVGNLGGLVGFVGAGRSVSAVGVSFGASVSLAGVQEWMTTLPSGCMAGVPGCKESLQAEGSGAVSAQAYVGFAFLVRAPKDPDPSGGLLFTVKYQPIFGLIGTDFVLLPVGFGASVAWVHPSALHWTLAPRLDVGINGGAVATLYPAPLPAAVVGTFSVGLEWLPPIH